MRPPKNIILITIRKIWSPDILTRCENRKLKKPKINGEFGSKVNKDIEELVK